MESDTLHNPHLVAQPGPSGQNWSPAAAAAVAAGYAPDTPPITGYVTQLVLSKLTEVQVELHQLEKLLGQTRERLFGSFVAEVEPSTPWPTEGNLPVLMGRVEMIQQQIRRLQEAALFLHEI